MRSDYELNQFIKGLSEVGLFEEQPISFPDIDLDSLDVEIEETIVLSTYTAPQEEKSPNNLLVRNTLNGNVSHWEDAAVLTQIPIRIVSVDGSGLIGIYLLTESKQDKEILTEAFERILNGSSNILGA